MQRSITITESAGYLKAGRILFYDDNARITRGATGALYHVPDTGSVARIPDREAALNAVDFRVEFNILSALHGIAEEAAVPPAALGETEDARPVLVTPYYERTLWSRLRNLLANNPPEAERLAVDAGLAFAGVMHYLRDGTVYASIERKVRDFFVMQDGRVVITGWGNLIEQSPEYAAAEVALFGSLWYELLTGLPAPARLNPADDMQWQAFGMPAIEGGAASVGLRVLLAAASALPPERRFPYSDNLPSYHPLAEALTKWKDVLALNNPAPDDLTEALEAFYATVPAGVLTREWKVFVRADVTWRNARTPETWAARDEALNALAPLLAEDAEKTPPEISPDDTVEEGIATDAGTTPAKPAYDPGRARRQLIDLLPDELSHAGASADAQEKIAALLDEVYATLEAPPADDNPEQLNHLRRLLDDVQTRLTNLKIESAEAMMTPLQQEIDLREQAVDYRSLSFQGRLRQFRELWQTGSTIPHLLTELSAPEAITPLEDILGYSGLMRTLETLFDQPLAGENDPETAVNRIDEIQQAYRLTLALANVHEREWLRDDLAPYVAYMQFVRGFYTGGSSDAGTLGTTLRGAEAMLANPYLQKPAILVTTKRIVIRLIQQAYNRMVESCQTGIPAEVNITAELWAALDSHAALIRQVLSEPEHYADDGHALTLSGKRAGGAWALLRIQGEQCRDVDALYDDWLKLVGQDSVYRVMQSAPDQSRLTALLKLFDRMKSTPGVNMSEILGHDDGMTVEAFRQMIAQALQDAKASVDAAEGLIAEARQRADDMEHGVEARIQRRIDEIRTQNWFKDAIDDQISTEFKQINAMATRLEQLNTYVEDRTGSYERDITGRISKIEAVVKQLDALTDDVQKLKQQQDTTLSRVTDIQSAMGRLTRLEATLDGKLDTLKRGLFTGFLDWTEKNTHFADASQVIDALNRMREEMERCPPEIFAPEHARWEKLYRQLHETLVTLARQSGTTEDWLREVDARTQVILKTASQKAAAAKA